MREWQLGPNAESGLLEIESRLYPSAKVIDSLKEFVNENRKKKIDDVLERRSLEYVFVLDQIHNHGNVSAILRTAEALGFQCVHRIHDPDGFKVSHRTSLGAESWMSLRHWEEPSECLRRLKDSGYQIAVSDLDTSTDLFEIDFSKPTAFVLGHEVKGVSRECLRAADVRFKLPQAGLTQSLNVSVASAVLMAEIFHHRRKGKLGDLTEKERTYLKAQLYCRQVNRARPILDRLVGASRHSASAPA